MGLANFQNLAMEATALLLSTGVTWSSTIDELEALRNKFPDEDFSYHEIMHYDFVYRSASASLEFIEDSVDQIYDNSDRTGYSYRGFEFGFSAYTPDFTAPYG